MAILLLIICFIAILFNVGIILKPLSNTKEIILISVLVFCGFLVLITEILSLFYILNFLAILLSWTTVTVINLIYLYLEKEKLKVFYNYLKLRIYETYLKIKTRSFYEKSLLVAVLLILILVFIQGIVYPPNNWDSMNYHLARVPSWIGHQSVAHYPTSVVWQIYMPPFAEYLAMNFNILNRADYFSNSVQFLALIFSVVGLVSIVDILGLSTSYKVLTIFLALTIPEAVLQATSTQNDLVVAFFVIAAFYFAIKSIRQFSLKNAFAFGLAVGLGILTKATAYIYLPAILIIYGISMLIQLYKTKNYNYLKFSLLAGLMFLTINIGFYHRNYQLSNNLFGYDQKQYGTYTNEKMNAKLFLSSVIKNAGVHIGLLHLKPLSVVAAHTIMRLHKIAGVDIDDPANNAFSDKYDTLYNPDHEDAAPNFIHLILITISLIIISLSFKRKLNLYVRLLAFTIIFQGLFFSFYLKYQPFHTRLHTSMFLLAIPLIVYALSLVNVKLKKVFYWFSPFIFLYALMIVLGNLNTPYNAKLKENRYEKYFISKPFLYNEYRVVNYKIKSAGYQNIGLIMGTESWVYAFFTDCYSKALNPIYLNVDNYTKNSGYRFNKKVDCILSTANNSPYMDYLGKRYYNQDPANQFIHLYK
ncbi:ArnT family glycosyltransferase [Mucilaginibacter arboris]|uniref:Glycosyltransferase RgtA/B/C/D-like domain-containing protein n=1 Tax=Mucilaginibacter arboris TaxID=2682090 RepID=A0A7K1SUU0_9SPHI|nr:glycosyltransferase family 39 protein [Mucilaginibacter arboris]MVN21096.1 hypothetical protein [Mucilaginibacter arboris]